MVVPKYIPLVCIISAVVWWVFFEWLRHRSYKKHIHTGFAPGTQHLSLLASFGALVLTIAGSVLQLFVEK